MRTYIDIIFHPDIKPSDFAEAMSGIGMEMLFGSHDFVIEWDSHEEFQRKFKVVLEIIQRFKLQYRLQTFEESQEEDAYINVALTK